MFINFIMEDFMKTFNKLLSMLIILVLFTGQFTISVADSRFDDTENHWAKSEIDKWSESGVITGFDGSFRPNDPITRAEMAAILNRIMIYQKIADNNFSDLADKWYTKDVLSLNAAGIMLGSGDNVRPEDNITREEAAVMFGRAFRIDESDGSSTAFSDAGTVSSWAAPLVFGMEEKGYILGSDGLFRPHDDISRAEIVKIVDNLISVYISKEGVHTDDVMANALINTEGVKLKGVNVYGNLYLTDGIADGTIFLEDVDVRGKTVVRACGMDSLNISGKSNFTIIEVCKPEPVHIRVTGEAIKAFLTLEKRDGLTVTEGADGSLDLIANNVVLDFSLKDISQPTTPLATVPTPPAVTSGGGGGGGGGGNGGTPLSNNAAVTSPTGAYTVSSDSISSGKEEIYFDKTTVGSLLQNLSKHQNAEWKVVADVQPTGLSSLDAVKGASAKVNTDILAENDKLCVIAQDGKAYKVYAILGKYEETISSPSSISITDLRMTEIDLEEATFSAKINKNGALYYVLLADSNSTTPTADQIITGRTSTATYAYEV
jgi:hypothetical protein